MRVIVCMLGLTLTLPAQTKAPKIWDDKALEDWATPIAALEVRPGHFTAAEYYAAPVENFTISFEKSATGGTMNIDWENTRASVAIGKN